MKSQIACVAGGTSGIGRALVTALLSRDWAVVAIGKGAGHAEAMTEELGGRYGERLKVFVADLRDPDAAAMVSGAINEQFGKLDLLINGAGTISAGGIGTETFEDWNRVITSNLFPLFTLSKACLPLLERAAPSSIISISSVCSLRPCASLSYSVSKAGTDMFTKVLARELAPKGIRVNAINPGVVRSNLQISAGLFASHEAYDEWVEKMKPSHPLGIGEPADLIGALLFLASTEARWITGATLSVDGGRAVA